MAGAALSQLLDFYSVTGQIVLTSPEAIVNEAQRPNYLWKWLLTGDSDKRLQGGKYIQDWIMFDAGNTAQFYLPGATRTYSNPQVMDNHQIDWRFLEDHMTFLDTDTDLQATSKMTTAARLQVYKDIIRIKEKRLATSLSGKMEDALFAQPNGTTMEGNTASATTPYSLFTFVNEFGASSASTYAADGINPYGQGTPSTFTTIANLNPSTQAGWRCWQINYSDIAPATSTVNPGASNVYDAMSKALMLTEAEEMPYKPSESTVNKVSMDNDYIFMCSLRGKLLMEKLARSSQNYFRLNPNDPHYNSPTFGGIPIKYIAGKNNAKHYPSSGTTAPAVGSGAGEYNGIGSANPTFEGPRFELISKQWMKPVFHDQHYFAMRPDIVPSAQPDTTVKIVNCWYNLFPRSRKKLACIYPSANITGV